MILTSYGVSGAEKILTEDYRPWKGDHLFSLAIVRPTQGKTVQVYRDSPELRAILTGPALPDRLPDLKDYPTMAIAPRTKCKIAGRTNRRCDIRSLRSEFVWISISRGERRGQRGLICETELGRTVAAL